MNDSEFDIFLHDALILAAAERYDSVPETDIYISPAYQRKFAKMLKNPFGYARNYQETWGVRLRRYALTAAIVLAILSAAIMAIPQTRAMAINMLTRWHEEYASFIFGNKAPLETLPEITIGYIPEGYELVYESDETDKVRMLLEYRNYENKPLFIEIIAVPDKIKFNFDNEHRQLEYLVLENGLEALYLKGIDVEWSSVLLWTSKKGEITFNFEGYLTKEELLNIANSIIVE